MSTRVRRISLAAVALAGVACGIVAAALLSGVDETVPVGADETVLVGSADETALMPASSTTTAAVPTLGPSTTLDQTSAGPLLVWTTGGLPAGFEHEVGSLGAVAELTVVQGDDVELTASWSATGAVVDDVAEGWFIPLDALAIDIETYGRVVPGADEVVAALAAPGSAVLGTTSAQLRGIGVGARIEIGGTDQLTITAVVSDDLVAAAEVMVSLETGATIGVGTARSALLRYDGDRSELEREIAGRRGDRNIRFRERGETAYLRHGDAVLPQSLIKHQFGEFSARHAPGTGLELDPVWVEENIVDVDLPVLGRTRCHKLIVPMLVSALDALADQGLTSLIDARDFGGCYAARLIAPGLGVSRHAWGVAVDVNVASNPLGGSSTQDPRLVDVMRRSGLAWGGEWLRADPMHFEYLTPPR